LSASTWATIVSFFNEQNKYFNQKLVSLHYTCATEVSKSNFNQNQKASIQQEPEFDKSFFEAIRLLPAEKMGAKLRKLR
jgi:hypothetical protein